MTEEKKRKNLSRSKRGTFVVPETLLEKENADEEVDFNEVSKVYGQNPYQREQEQNIFDFQESALKEQISSFEEIKEFIIHQLVVSYNLYKITKEIVDKVLNSINTSHEVYDKIDSIYKEIIDKREDKPDWNRYLIVALLILQSLTLLVLFFTLF